MIPNKTINAITIYLLYAVAFAFVLFYLMLSYYNRTTCDDFGNIYYAKGKNLFEYVKLFYNTYGGRWMSWAYIYIVFAARENFQSIPVFIFIYYAVTLFIFIFSIKEIIRIGAVKLFSATLSNKTTITFAILFLACFYFFTFNTIETWWYICSSFHYIQGIAFLLLGIALLLKEQVKTIHYLLIVISFLYVGSGFEMYALIAGSLLLICILYLKKKNLPLKKTLIALITLAISGIITFIAPGNFVRRNYFKENVSQFLHPVTFDGILAALLQQKFVIGFLIAAAFLILGMRLQNNSTSNQKIIKKVFNFSIISFLLSVVIVYFMSLFFTFGIMPPGRAWTFTSFAFTFFICFSFLRIGYSSLLIKKHFRVIIPLFISSVLLVIFVFNLYNQYVYASTYSKKYDEFINSLLVAKKNNQTVPFYMKRLPNSGMLMKLEMTEDTSNPKHLKNILGVKFEVIVKEN